MQNQQILYFLKYKFSKTPHPIFILQLKKDSIEMDILKIGKHYMDTLSFSLPENKE